MMAKASRVVWLGFGFHDQNMELLLPEKNHASHLNDAVHFATAVGVSDFNCNAIRSFIAERSNSRRDNIYIAKEVACAKLLEDDKKGLQFPHPV